MTYAGFVALPNGTEVRNHSDSQCVAVANLYHEGVLRLRLPSGFTTAHEWWTRRHEKPEIYENYTFSSDPVPGALVVMLGGIYNATAGHIGLVYEVRAGGFATLEQNAAHRYLYRYFRVKDPNVLGFLVPKSIRVPTVDEIMEATVSNPIISVPDATGTLYIGTDEGDFVEYSTPRAANSRGILSKAFYGGPGGDTDTIPALSWADFAVVRTVWRQMRTGAGVTVDTKLITQAVSDAIAAQGVQVDVAAIAAAVDEALADDFAAIPAQIGKKLAS